jgi:hypothetical protein
MRVAHLVRQKAQVWLCETVRRQHQATLFLRSAAFAANFTENDSHSCAPCVCCTGDVQQEIGFEASIVSLLWRATTTTNPLSYP